MNKIRKLKYKKGFTLSELIIVIAIMSLLIAAAAAFAQPVQGMVNGTNATSDTITTTKIIGDYIERRLSFAKSACIFTNVNSSASDENINKMYESYSEMVKKADEVIDGKKGPLNGKIKCGMLVFKYIDNGERSTYKLYDDSIAANKTYTPPSSAVFTDDFYGRRYSYFMTVEPYMVEDDTALVAGTYKKSVKVNGLKDRAYLGFSIRAYADCEGSKYISNDMMSNYYAKLKTPGDTTITDNIGLLAMNRTAFEEISFAMENVKVSRSDTGEAEQSSVTYGEPALAANAGSDIIVFYCVQDYSKTP